jgi:hypothetical protein
MNDKLIGDKLIGDKLISDKLIGDKMIKFDDKNGKPVLLNKKFIMAIEYIDKDMVMKVRFNCYGDQIAKYPLHKESFHSIIESHFI